jgi:hypothetical protein
MCSFSPGEGQVCPPIDTALSIHTTPSYQGSNKQQSNHALAMSPFISLIEFSHNKPKLASPTVSSLPNHPFTIQQHIITLSHLNFLPNYLKSASVDLKPSTE